MNDAPASQVQSENAEMLDRYYHKLLQQGGMKVVSGYREDGSAIIELIDLTAAMCNAINARLKTLKIQSPAGVGGITGGLMAEAERRMRYDGRDVTPPLNTEDDDAATEVG